MPHLELGTFVSQVFWLVISFASCYLVILFILLPSLGMGLRKRRDLANLYKSEAQASLDRVDFLNAEVKKMNEDSAEKCGLLHREAIADSHQLIAKKIAEVNEEFLKSVASIQLSKKNAMLEIEKELPKIIQDISDKVWISFTVNHKGDQLQH